MPEYKIVPELERDRMPVEVATEMLVAGRLTNSMRKRCILARERVFYTGRPLVRVLQERNTSLNIRQTLKAIKAAPLCEDAATSSMLPEDKLARKFKTKDLRQLRNIAVRAVRSRRKLQANFEKIANDTSKKATAERKLIEFFVQEADVRFDVAESAINSRTV